MKVQSERAVFWWALLSILIGFWVMVGMVMCDAAHAQRTWDVNLAWDANSEPDLKEYRLYENSAQVEVIPAGTETVTRVLPPGSYTWYLTAVDESLNESGPSNSVGLTLDEQAPDVSTINISISISVHTGP